MVLQQQWGWGHVDINTSICINYSHAVIIRYWYLKIIIRTFFWIKYQL